METRFDKRIYLPEAIREAIEAFSEVAEISFSEDSADYVVSFSGIDSIDIDIIFGEFGNYAIAATKIKKNLI